VRIHLPEDILQREHLFLGIILIAGLVIGLFFVFFIPPWQHYDEPTRFEYAWLIANQDGLPEIGTYDQAMRREVAASMIEHNFFNDKDFSPNLLTQSEPIWIGISQVEDPPVYYWGISLLLQAVRTSDITFQLYLGRLISLSLFLISIIASYGIVSELTRPGHWLRLVLPATMILIPSYVDIMTSVNNDVGATAFFLLFMWLCVRIIQRGFSWILFVVASILAVLCYFTKETVAIAIPLLFVTLLFSIPKLRQKNIVWLFLAGVMLLFITVSFTWNGVVAWYTQDTSDTASQVEHIQAPLGSRVLRLVPPAAGLLRSRVVQLVPEVVVSTLQGEIVTLGAWIWSNETVTVRTPILDDGTNIYAENITVGDEPQFFAITVDVPEDTSNIKIILESAERQDHTLSEVYYDGIILVIGDYFEEGEPHFADIRGKEGVWGESAFENIIRNSSIEMAWFRLRPGVETILSSLVPFEPSRVLTSLIDWPGAGWYYRASVENMVRTFYAKFGWGQVLLIFGKPYRIIGIVTLFGILGFIMAAWRRRQKIQWDIITFMGIALFSIWFSAIIRGEYSLFWNVFIPGARYSYPAIVPTLLILCIGWFAILDQVIRWLRIPKYISYVIYFGSLIILNIVSLISIYDYFYV
jgi:hypothetical protein